MPQPSDAELVARARDGDRAAFRVLVERHEAPVVATITAMLGRSAEVDDVAQETFIRFYQALDHFRGEAAVGTYLTRIAINLSLNALRQRRRFLSRFFSRDDEAAAPEPALDAEAQVDVQERARLVERALLALEPRHRAVVVLRLVEGYSTRETAEILEIPQGTVLSRLSRAQQRLRDLLGPLLHEPAGSSTNRPTP